MPKRRFKRRVVRRKRPVRRKRRRNSSGWSRPKVTSYATTKKSAKKHSGRSKRWRSMSKTKKRRKAVKKYGASFSTKKRSTSKRKTKKKTTRKKKGISKAAARKRALKAARTRAANKKKRSTAAKKAARKRGRKTTKRRTKRKTTKKRGRKSQKRSRAMKRAWAKRRKGYRVVKKGRKKVRRLYRTKRGRTYKKAKAWGGSFRRHRNQNKNWLMTIGLGGVGLYLVDLITGWTQKKAEEKGYASRLQVAGASIVPIAVPMAISYGLMKYGHKVIKDTNIRSTLSMAFGMAGILAAVNAFVVPKLPANIQSKIGGMSGYVVTNGMKGYVRSGMRGYVKSLGMGSMPASRMLSQGTMSGLPQASFGSGSGLQVERRTYDKYQWGGVLSKNVFED